MEADLPIRDRDGAPVVDPSPPDDESRRVARDEFTADLRAVARAIS